MFKNKNKYEDKIIKKTDKKAENRGGNDLLEQYILV